MSGGFQLFPTRAEIARNMRATLPLFLLKPRAEEGIDPDRLAARRSFTVYWITLPAGLLAAWVFDRPYLAAAHTNLRLYLAYQFVGGLLSLAASLLLVYAIARLDQASANFPRFVTAVNWSGLWWLLYSIPLIGLVQSGWLSHQQITYVGNGQFFLTAFYGWVFLHRLLGLNPVAALGLALAMMAPAGLLDNFINLRLFGMMEPFYGK